MFAIVTVSCPCEGFGYLAPLADWITYDLLHLGLDRPFSAAVRFFLFETPKVLLLLTLVVFVMGVVRSFFSKARTRQMLTGVRAPLGNLAGACLGVLTPFCSCSAVPLFIAFVTSGVPLGVTFSFLIASPMVSEVALVLLLAMFGWKVALLYAGTGLTLAVVAGWIIGRLHMEPWVEPWVYTEAGATQGPDDLLTWRDRLQCGYDAMCTIVGKVWLYVLAGIAVGAGIHGYVPQDYLASFMGRDAWWCVPLAVLLGVPMYSNAAGVIPVMTALLGKGAALGTVLAFTMAVIGLSLPEAVILRKVLKPRLLLTFFGVVALGIVTVGYLFNAVLAP